MTKYTLFMIAAISGILGTMVASPSDAKAAELTGEFAGSLNADNYGFINTPSPMLAADLTFGMSPWQYGLAYDHNFLSYSGGGSGALNFYGALVRFDLLDSLFVDGQAGIETRDGSGTSFSWGFGAGYRFSIGPAADIGPRVSYRFLPDSGAERSLADFGIFLTLKLM